MIGHERLWACGDCVSFPHPRWGRIAIPHWDHALWSGRHVADSILGSTAPYVREPYFFSDIGRLRIQQVGVADAAVEWHEDDGLVVGRDPKARPPACSCSTHRRACARPVSSSPPSNTSPPDDLSPTTPQEDTIMLVRVIVDPDACIGSAECVALDPEAVEARRARHRTDPSSRTRRRTRQTALRRVPHRCSLDHQPVANHLPAVEQSDLGTDLGTDLSGSNGPERTEATPGGRLRLSGHRVSPSTLAQASYLRPSARRGATPHPACGVTHSGSPHRRLRGCRNRTSLPRFRHKGRVVRRTPPLPAASFGPPFGYGPE